MYGNYKILVTDFRGNLVYEIDNSDFISLDIVDVLNDSGSFKLKSKTKGRCPILSGTAVIIFRDDIQIYNGYVTRITEEYDMASKAWKWEVSGENHIGLLKHRLIYPLINNSGRISDRYRSILNTSVDSVISQLIYENMCENQYDQSHPHPLWIVENTQSQETHGSNISISYRFDNLHQTVANLATEYGYAIYAVTNPANYRITYYAKQLEDKSANIIFSTGNDDLTNITIFSSPVTPRFYVASYNSENKYLNVMSNPEMWRFVKDGTVPYSNTGWAELCREEFYVPNKEDFIVSYSSGTPNYDWTEEKLNNIVGSYANAAEEESDGIELGLDLLNQKYTYGYDMDRGPFNPWKSDQFLNDYQLGTIVSVDFFGETIQQMVTQMKISVKYGDETISPVIGAVQNGSFTSLIRSQKQTENDILKSQNKEIPV